MKLNVQVAGVRLRLAGVWVTFSLLALAGGSLLHLGHSPIAARVVADNASSPWLADGRTGRLYAHAMKQAAPAATEPGSQIAFGKIPLSFEANQGQSDAEVKFLARGGGYTLFLTQDEAVLKLQSSVVGRQSPAKRSVSTQHSEATTSVVRMKLVGASARADISGANQLPSRSNYFVGRDPAKWRRNVPQFARVRYGQVYPGIDLVYYGKQGRLEYDFVVAPGADPEQIGWQTEGANKLHLSAKGDLVAATAAGEVQLHAPEVYQKIGDQKHAVTAKFVLSADHRVQFRLGQYDRRRELVIDPQLTFAEYFGGSADEGCAFTTGTYTSPVAGCPAVAVDGSLNSYVAGTTTSSNLPVTNGTTLNGAGPDVFIAKFTSAGAPVYVTYLGGSGIDTPVGVGLDPATQRVYVGGNTTSADFPVVNEIPTGTLSAGNHAFVTLLDTLSSTLVYSTYLAGSGTDTATGFTNDNAGNAYVTGITSSANFPTTAGSLQATDPDAAFSQFFISKVATSSSGLSSLAYSTYFGSSHAPASGAVLQGGGIAVSAGFVYISGATNFLHTGIAGDFPIVNALQPCLDSPGVTSSCPASVTNTDAFVAKINPVNSGSQLLYSTYLGGSGVEVPHGIAVDSGGNAYVTGSTDSTNFPIVSTSNAFQASNRGGTDVFVAKLGASGIPIPLSYSSYLGGTGNDAGYAIAVDIDQAVHVTGVTTSTDLTGVNPIAGTGAGAGASAFAAVIQTTFAGTTGGYSTYLQTAGANGDTDGTGIAVDLNANTYVVGETSSSGIPANNGSALSGGSDAFLTKISPTATGITITPSTSVTSGSTAGIGNQVTFTYTIKNAGPGVASNVLFTDFLPATGATFASASSTPGSCTAAVNGSVTCAVGSLGGTPSAPGQATVKINLTPTVAGTLTNNGTLQASGAPAGASSASVTVTDFAVGVSPATISVAAGNSATYQVQVGIPVGQTSFFPDAVSLSCSAGVPTGAACTFSTNPVTLTSTSPISSTLTITTTARPVTTTSGRLERFRAWYAALLPITGLTFLGLGVGTTRRRQWVIGIFAVLVFAFAGLQLACSGSSGTSTPPTGTPAGTYPITLTGTSGSASHAVRMTLIVQ